MWKESLAVCGLRGGENNLTDDKEKIEISGRTDVDLSNSTGEFAYQLF